MSVSSCHFLVTSGKVKRVMTKPKIVFSTDPDWRPEDPKAAPQAAEAAPGAQTARVARERRQKGKVVTVVSGLSHCPEAFEKLAKTLKTKCGAGGTVKDGTIEIQGDQVARVAETLAALGYRVKK